MNHPKSAIPPSSMRPKAGQNAAAENAASPTSAHRSRRGMGKNGFPRSTLSLPLGAAKCKTLPSSFPRLGAGGPSGRLRGRPAARPRCGSSPGI